MPIVLREYEISVNILVDMILDEASSATPISSGKGEAITKQAITGNKYFLNNPGNLLFEKGAFILEQYRQGYERINEPLVVQVEPIDKDKEIKNILEKNKNYKSEEDVKQLVKIRIAEKFNVKRNEKAKLIRLKI